MKLGHSWVQACKFLGVALGVAFTAAVLAMPALQAASIRSFSPQGTVAKVRQVVVQFDAAVVAFGEPRLAAPVTLACEGASAEEFAGSGRWVSDREWVFDFDEALPDGVRCVADKAAGFVPISETGATGGAGGRTSGLANGLTGGLTGTTRYEFQTGGPRVLDIRPYTYYAIDEEQYFALRLSAPVSSESLREHMWCVSENVGERIAVRVVDEAERAVLARRYYGVAGEADAPRHPVVTCNRRLTAGSRVKLVFGTEVRTVSGVAGQVDRSFDYRVRREFSAEFTCKRENANAACLPNQPMQLSFNAPITREFAAQVYLERILPRAGGDGEKSSEKSAGKPARIYAKLTEGDDNGGSDGSGNNALLPTLLWVLDFPPTGEENQRYALVLPEDLSDDVGRPLRNADQFPLSVATGEMPPLVKFAAAPFGIVERFAEGRGDADTNPALLPVTVRRVEADLAVQTLDASKIYTLKVDDDAAIIAWLHKVQRYHAGSVTRTRARRDGVPLPPKPPRDSNQYYDYDNDNDWRVGTRRLSLLAGHGGVQTLALPKQADAQSGAQSPRQFEVVGIPLHSGFHVLEIASSLLGQALLDNSYGGARTMFVRTSALVTNLAVHYKQGRDDALAWVTRLDDGSVVANARVQVSDCQGEVLAQAVTDGQGVARLAGVAAPRNACYDQNDDYLGRGHFVSARVGNIGQPQDLAFVWSHWQGGIEPWRFGVPTTSYSYYDRDDEVVAHTVFDRTLFRAGETVSMKHTLRRQVGIDAGSLAALVRADLPERATIEHVGSGLTYTVPLDWQQNASSDGAVWSATSEFATPPAARLGEYTVTLSHRRSGSFRVEAFRLPVFEGRIVAGQAGGGQPQQPLVAVDTLPAQIHVSYLSGGAASGLDVQVSALVRGQDEARRTRAQWPRFRFDLESDGRDYSDDEDEDEANGHANLTRLVADKLPLKLDANGQGAVTLTGLAGQGAQPQQLRIEATYADPSGEVQTLSATRTLWPAEVVAGIRAERWISTEKTLKFQTLALGLDDKPLAGVPLKVEATALRYVSSRKRLVGGFYSYDTQRVQTPLGVVCEGVSDAQGLLECTTQLKQSGEVELRVTAVDDAGRAAAASTSVWVHAGELWFARGDDDRMDVIPEKPEYQPGETARFQVRMPYREATALVTVEREGISETHVVQLKGDNPTVELKVRYEWGPNAYISVLALRGRIHESPWYGHLFAEEREKASGDYRAPTTLVDLSKPSFRLGMAEVRVGTTAHRVDVQVTTDQTLYQVRESARVTIAATLPNGSPAAHAEVAVAAVDQALLELMPNRSWNLLDAMLKRRAWGVATATAQMEIIGRRHYGRKAIAPGGDGAGAGGPRSQQRTLFDTLLFWQPRVQLDAHGRAEVTVPLNDSLTRFQIVAVVEHGVSRFGTGSAAITATQNLQIVSGLPPLIRAGDTFDANLTLRNTTDRDMAVRLVARAAALVDAVLAPAAVDALGLPEQTVQIPAGSAEQIRWPVNLSLLAANAAGALTWDIEATEVAADRTQLRTKPKLTRDSVKIAQRIVPSVPLTVLQGTLFQLNRSHSVPVAPPIGALAHNGGAGLRPLGGLNMTLAPTLATGLAGIRNWWHSYPYACLEQKTSKNIGLNDADGWRRLMAQLPGYLDRHGLASYFPVSDGGRNRGSDTLTAHLLSLSAHMQKLDARFVIPDSERRQMQAALLAYIEGRIQIDTWRLLQKHERDARKIAAIAALAVSYQSDDRRATPAHVKALVKALETLRVAPNEWPTHTVIDWVALLTALQLDQTAPHAGHLKDAQRILRARLNYQGSRAGFSNEADDDWWWLMHSADTNLARLVLLNLEHPDWQHDLPRLVSGFIARQKNGAWRTTTANLWGALALQRFSQRFESEAVAGVTRAAVAKANASANWENITAITPDELAQLHANHDGISPLPHARDLKNNTLFLPWPEQTSTGGKPQPAKLTLTQQGTGKPWVTLQAVAAVPLAQPLNAGYRITRSVEPVTQQNPSLPDGYYSRGDILRVTLTVNASADMGWVAITDPIPAGATILGSGLGRDSQIATQGETSTPRGWLAWTERDFESWRSYWEYLPRGATQVQYTVRLNQTGNFTLPPSRAEALYAPDMLGMTPNGRVVVE